MERDKDGIDPENGVFLAIPACEPILNDPNFEVEPTHSRRYFDKTGENSFLARTLKTSDTIEAWCSLYNRITADRPMKDEGLTLLSLQSGLDGYPQVCHGGLVATVLDEVCSILVSECRWSQNLSPENVTADLRITFVKPVKTPGVVLVKARVTDVQKGKKYYVKAAMVDLEGVVRARAEGLFICVGLQKL